MSDGGRRSSHTSLHSISEGAQSGSSHSVYSSTGRWSQMFDSSSTRSLPRRSSSAAYTEPFIMPEDVQDNMYGTMSKASRRYYDRHSHQQQTPGKFQCILHGHCQSQTPTVTLVAASPLRAAVRRDATPIVPRRARCEDAAHDGGTEGETNQAVMATIHALN